MKIDISKLEHEPQSFDEELRVEAERLGPDQVAGTISSIECRQPRLSTLRRHSTKTNST